MVLNNKFWYFDSAVPSRICDHIIKYALAHKDNLGTVSGTKKNPSDLNRKDIKQLYKKRKSHVVWLNDHWIYKEIHPYIHLANKNAGWNFQWDWSESCQFTKYKKGQYYGWHVDSDVAPFTKEGPSKGKIRKLSSIVLLSDPSQYKGGNLQFNFKNNELSNNIVTCKELKNKGTLIVFPSFLWHRVKSVTQGIRYSLVSWHLGNPFV